MFPTQLTFKWPFMFPPHWTSVSVLPDKTKTDKICIKINKKTIKFYLFRYVATNNQSITRLDKAVKGYIFKVVKFIDSLNF